MIRQRATPIRRVLALIVLTFLSSVTGSVLAADDASLYLVDSTFSGNWTRIFQVDPATGVMTLRADLGTTFTPVFGLAAANRTTLYLAGTDNGPGQLCEGHTGCLLIRVDLDPDSTTPATVQVIAPFTEDGSMLPGMTGMNFRRDGKLYASSQETDGLYIVDLLTAVATRVGIIDVDVHGADITFDSTDRLWLWSNIGPASGLYSVDPATAHASLFDLHPDFEMAGLAAVGHGAALHGASQMDDHLHEIDTVVGMTGTRYRLMLDGQPFDHRRGDLDSPFCEEDAACDDGDSCTADRCSPGGCEHPAEEDGTSCDDANACTRTDTCQSGACTGTDPVICTPSDDCLNPGACDPGSGLCGPGSPKPDGTACSDGILCTVGDSCQVGICTGQALLDRDEDQHVDALCGGDDCFDLNPLVWTSPREVEHLSTDGGGPTAVAWHSQAALSGPATVYDLVSVPILATGGPNLPATDCLLSGGGTEFTDLRPNPALGQAVWYLARARNSCGVGTYGSSGLDGAIPPCP